MASYYYLLSSLPMLRADGGLPLTYSDFLGMCKSALGDGKYAFLENLTLSSGKGPLLTEWSKYYAALERELINFRNQRLNRPTQNAGTRDETLFKEVSAAIGGKNPLEAEKALLALEFKKIDELIGTHYFDDHALTGYALKLKLLERKYVFDQVKGKAELDRILDGLQKQILIGEREQNNG